MATVKEMRTRIGSVKSTQKITKALQMVAAAKLRRSQQAAEAARPYAQRMAAIISNLAASVSVRDPGCGVARGFLQPVGVSGFNLVSQGSSLAVSNSRMTRSGCSALIGSRLDGHARKACFLQLTADQPGIVIAVRRASQKARWIARKYLGERVRYIVGEDILLDAIPYIKEEMTARLEDPLCLTIAR